MRYVQCVHLVPWFGFSSRSSGCHSDIGVALEVLAVRVVVVVVVVVVAVGEAGFTDLGPSDERRKNKV